MPKHALKLRDATIPPHVMEKVGSRLAILLAGVTMPIEIYKSGTPQRYKIEWKILYNLELAERASKIKAAIDDLRLNLVE